MTVFKRRSVVKLWSCAQLPWIIHGSWAHLISSTMDRSHWWCREEHPAKVAPVRQSYLSW